MPIPLLERGTEGYQYLSPGGIAFNLTALLMGMILGGLLACILTVLHHAVVGRFFRELIARGATSRENAKRLSELEGIYTFGLRRALRSPSSLLRKLVSSVLPDGRIVPPLHSLDDDRAAREAANSAIHAEDGPILHAEEGEIKGEELPPPPVAEVIPEELLAPEGTRVDPTTAAFYLDDLHRRRAEIRFAKRGNEARLLIPTAIAFVVLAVVLPIYMPYFVELLDSIIASILGG